MRQIDPQTLRLLPDSVRLGTFLTVLLIPLTVQWWSVWYPGAEPGGGSYVAQRMLASRSEKDARRRHAALQRRALRAAAVAVDHRRAGVDDGVSRRWTTSRAHCRTWTRSLIGHDMAYPAMLRFLPPGLMGLMIAGLLAAYVSTISTHLNWGTSYVVHDLYRRFLQPGETEKHYVLVGRLVTAALMVVAGLLTLRARDRAGELQPAALGRRGHRAALPAALVLVAHQRVVGDRGDGQLVRRRGRRSSSPIGRARRFLRTCRCSSASRSPPSCGWRRRS